MGGPLSVTFADIFMTKLERNCLKPPITPKLYKRYVDDCFVQRKKNQPDQLFIVMNSYHKNIRFTIEIDPKKFLDTKLIRNDSTYTTAVHHKETKVTPHWTSAIPKRYKRNTINGELSRAAKISSNFEKEKKAIRQKFSNAGYPTPFVNSVIRDFESKQDGNPEVDDYIIPPNFFEETTTHYV